MKTTLKILFTILLFVSVFVLVQDYKQVYAIDCTLNVNPTCNPLDDPNCDMAPRPSQLFCPFLRAINFGILAVGVIFAVYVGYGAIKLSLSLGDPKAMDGARKTWTYAIIGLLVVLFSWFSVSVMNSMFNLGLPITPGGGSNGLNLLIDQAVGSLENFLGIVETP